MNLRQERELEKQAQSIEQGIIRDNSVKKHQKYFQLTSVLEYMAKEGMIKEALKVCSLKRFISSNTLMVEVEGVGELLTLPEYRELQCNVSTILF